MALVDRKSAIQLSAAESKPKERGCVHRTSRSGHAPPRTLEGIQHLWTLQRAAARASHTAANRRICAARDTFGRY